MTTTPNKDGGPHAAAVRLLEREVAELTRAAEDARERSLAAEKHRHPAVGRMLDRRAATFSTQAEELQGTIDALRAAPAYTVVIRPSGQEYTRFPTPEEVEAARVEVETTVRKAVARLVQAMTDDGK